MEANQMVIRHWEDVVFENRNKSYGAYLLRRAYTRRLLSALGVTVAVVALLLTLQGSFSNDGIRQPDLPPFRKESHIFQQPPSIKKKTPARRVVDQPKKTPKKNSPVIVTKQEVVTEDEVTALEEFVSGEDFESGLMGATDGIGTLSLPEPEPVIKKTVLDIAEVMPQYEGGLEAMMKFIQKEIRYPRAPRQMGIQGTVYVKFVVNGDGTITDVEVLRGVHPDYDREAMRVISMLPAWKGGSHNGRPVSVRMVLPIKFSLR